MLFRDRFLESTGLADHDRFSTPKLKQLYSHLLWLLAESADLTWSRVARSDHLRYDLSPQR